MQQNMQHIPMNTTSSRKVEQVESWPYKVTYGSVTVAVYKRSTPSGYENFMVADDSTGKRKFVSFRDKDEALAAADKLARKKAGLAEVVQKITTAEAIQYFSSVARLKPLNLTLDAATAAVVACVTKLGGLAALHAATDFYLARHKVVKRMPVADVVADLLKVKAARGASERYLRDLKTRLERFAGDCKMDAGAVTTADAQAWLDSLNLSAQSHRNYQVVLHTLFAFAVARGFASDNPIAGCEKVKVRGNDIEIFTPVEIARLLDSARSNHPEFVPVIAIGAFCGLRSAELERLEWSDIDLTARHIVLGKSKSKTASRRIVPIPDNLAEWLTPHAHRQGKVWKGTGDMFYKAQTAIAQGTAVAADADKGIRAKAAVAWKQNGLRHSFASYKFALTNNAGELAGIMGNSAAMIFKHYRELVKPADAQRWFSVTPTTADNIITLPAAATA